MLLKLRTNAHLQSSETAELVERLEDAQMALGSMASSRFGAPFCTDIVAWLGKLGLISEQVQALKLYRHPKRIAVCSF